jgi:hypothetical protein
MKVNGTWTNKHTLALQSYSIKVNKNMLEHTKYDMPYLRAGTIILDQWIPTRVLGTLGVLGLFIGSTSEDSRDGVLQGYSRQS